MPSGIYEGNKGHKQSKKTKKKIGETLKGNKNNWQGGTRKTSTGYIIIYAPEHPHAFISGKVSKYIYEHRLVMEKHLGRYLLLKEWVHHKNGIRDDNRIENLELVIPGYQLKNFWRKNFFLKDKQNHGLEVGCPFCKEKFIVKK